jgi:hypothetical protein
VNDAAGFIDAVLVVDEHVSGEPWPPALDQPDWWAEHNVVVRTEQDLIHFVLARAGFSPELQLNMDHVLFQVSATIVFASNKIRLNLKKKKRLILNFIK